MSTTLPIRRELRWGETPWDDLSREELLREVQRMYAALIAAHSAFSPVLTVLQRNGMVPERTWLALEMVGQALVAPASTRFTAEQIYRAFFRYAGDLLFEQHPYRIGSNWAICDVCKSLIAGEEKSLDGSVCGLVRGTDCSGVLRAITWDDLKPQPEEAKP